MTVLVVLILLSVMLMGGMALARLGEVGTLSAGNVASKEAAMQASQVGVANAFAMIQQAGFNENLAIATDDARGVKYYAKIQPADEYGMPKFDTAQWDELKSVTVGRYQIRTVVERLCDKDLVSNKLQDCLVREDSTGPENAGASVESLEPANARQYRATVRVTDQKGTETFVQAMLSAP
jgi:hypothetical protein